MNQKKSLIEIIDTRTLKGVTNLKTGTEAEYDVSPVCSISGLLPVVWTIMSPTLLSKVYNGILQLTPALVTQSTRLVSSNGRTLRDVKQSGVLPHRMTLLAYLKTSSHPTIFSFLSPTLIRH